MDSPSSPHQSPPSPGVGRRKMRKGTRSCVECRRRKIRCIYTRDSLLECVGCLDKGCRCVNQEFANIRELRARKTVNERLARLEYLMECLIGEESLQDESLQEGDIEKVRNSITESQASKPLLGRKKRSDTLPPISSLFENDVWMRIGGQLTSCAEPPEGQTGEDGDEDMDDRNESRSRSIESSKPTLIPRELRISKNRRVCEAILAVMPNQTRFQEAIAKCGDVWAYIVKNTMGPAATPTFLSLPLFVRHSAQQEDAVSLAKALQMVASVMDVQTHDRYLSLVNELIINDHDYMTTIGGMECCFQQGSFFAQIGQAKRAWLAFRRGMKYMQLMDLHNTRRNGREEALWWLMFTSDRFASLCLATEYAIPNSHCNLNSFDGGKSVWTPDPEQTFALKLAIEAGKLLDFLHGRAASSYDAALLMDQDLTKMAEELPESYWDLTRSASTAVDDMIMLLKKAWGHSIYFTMKVMLHMPYMFKAIKNPGYGFSRDKCFEAARALIRCVHITRGSVSTKDHGAFDFLGFVGCIVLLLGLQGYGNEDAKESNMQDWERIESTIELFKGRADKPFDQIASQSYRALLQLTRFKRQPETARDGVVQVNVPIFGTITVRRGQLEQVATMHTTYTGLSTDKEVGQLPTATRSVSRNASKPGLQEEAESTYASAHMRMRANAMAMAQEQTQYPNYTQQLGIQLSFESNPNRVGIEPDWSWLLADMNFDLIDEHFT